MKNQNDIDKLLDEMIDSVEKVIDIVFAKRLISLHKRIAKMYRKYSTGGELTWTDINLYNRFNSEMKLIKKEIHNDYKELFKQIQKLMVATYIENYLRSGFLYEFEAQKKMWYEIPSIKTVKAVILNPISKLQLPELMNEHRNEVIKKINIEISQSLLNGEDYSAMAKRIEGVTGFASFKARRVARTESGRVSTESRLKSAEHASKHANLTKKWNSALDLKVRKSHRVLDGKSADADGYFHYKGMKSKGPHKWNVPHMDINCRCALLFLVNGKNPELRRARNEDGSTSVIPYMTYEEWYKTLPKAG